MAFGIRNLTWRKHIFDTKSLTRLLSTCAKNKPPLIGPSCRSSFFVYPISRRFHNEYNRSKYNKNYIVSGIIPVGIIAYILYKRKSSLWKILPEVEAATRRSVRDQFNFIADVVEVSSGAVVCIDIKDTRR